MDTQLQAIDRKMIIMRWSYKIVVGERGWLETASHPLFEEMQP